MTDLWIALRGRCTVDAGEDQPAFERPAGERGSRLRNHSVDRISDVLIESDGLFVVDLLQTALVFEAQTVIERELRVDAPVVLEIQAPVLGEPFELPGSCGTDPV